MKKFITALCCAFMASFGYFVTNMGPTSVPQNTLHAATIPSWNYNGPLPLDLELDRAKKIIKPDTVVIHDTITVKNTKYVRVPVPHHTTDTIYVPLQDLQEVVVTPVKNRSPGSLTETFDAEQCAKQGIVLIIDGSTVYSSKKDFSSEVPDEP